MFAVDALNYFMRDRGLPRPMRMTLRDYFQSARKVHQVVGDTELIARMTPLLQGTVALAANKRWLDHIWYFRTLGQTREGREFVASLAKSLVVRAYIAHERLPVGQLYVLRRGLVVKMWRFLGAGKVWGEDMILDNPELVDHSQAVALTYIEAFTLRRPDLEEVLLDYPFAYRTVRKAAKRIQVQRSLLKYLCVFVAKRDIRSFATRSAASGFTEVRSELSVDQKLDMLLHKHDFGSRASRESYAPGALLVDPPNPVASGVSTEVKADITELQRALVTMQELQTKHFEQLAAAQNQMTAQLQTLTETVAGLKSKQQL
jgi:CRP-like cAMP-binding protein